jgi:hypothetical protein
VLFRGLTINNSLESIDLTNNQFGEEDGVMEAFKSLVKNNKKIKYLNFSFNGFYEEGAQKILEFLNQLTENEFEQGISLVSLILPEKIPNELLKAVEKAIKDNKLRKGKGKAKKKGKKKGKKKK